MTKRSITLSEHFDEFIASGVKHGHYRDADDVIQEALLLLEQRDQEEKDRQDWLQEVAGESIASLDRGEGITFHSMDAMSEWLQQLARDAEAKVSARRAVA